MRTKLTLTLEQQLIEKAKEYAAEQGTSLSEMVTNYFSALTAGSKTKSGGKIASRTSKLRGVLKSAGDIDYKKALEEEMIKKHLGKDFH